MQQIRHQKQQLWAWGQRGFWDGACCVRLKTDESPFSALGCSQTKQIFRGLTVSRDERLGPCTRRMTAKRHWPSVTGGRKSSVTRHGKDASQRSVTDLLGLSSRPKK